MGRKDKGRKGGSTFEAALLGTKKISQMNKRDKSNCIVSDKYYWQ